MSEMMAQAAGFKGVEHESSKILKIFQIFVDNEKILLYNATCVVRQRTGNKETGVWLSLARVPDLGSGGRRFESCHPDFKLNNYFAGVVQLTTSFFILFYCPSQALI